MHKPKHLYTYTQTKVPRTGNLYNFLSEFLVQLTHTNILPTHFSALTVITLNVYQ